MITSVYDNNFIISVSEKEWKDDLVFPLAWVIKTIFLALMSLLWLQNWLILSCQFLRVLSSLEKLLWVWMSYVISGHNQIYSWQERSSIFVSMRTEFSIYNFTNLMIGRIFHRKTSGSPHSNLVCLPYSYTSGTRYCRVCPFCSVSSDLTYASVGVVNGP